MIREQQNNNEEKPLRVRRGRVDSVDLYEVKESELDILENGSPTSIHLNFSIFLLSLAFSSIVCLATATFTSGILENTFLFVSIIGILGGIYLIILWWKGRKSIGSIISKIKRRIPPDYIEQSTISPEENLDPEIGLDDEDPVEPES